MDNDAGVNLRSWFDLSLLPIIILSIIVLSIIVLPIIVLPIAVVTYYNFAQLVQYLELIEETAEAVIYRNLDLSTRFR